MSSPDAYPTTIFVELWRLVGGGDWREATPMDSGATAIGEVGGDLKWVASPSGSEGRERRREREGFEGRLPFSVEST